jgi:hypothetical protein
LNKKMQQKGKRKVVVVGDDWLPMEPMVFFSFWFLNYAISLFCMVKRWGVPAGTRKKYLPGGAGYWVWVKNWCGTWVQMGTRVRWGIP